MSRAAKRRAIVDKLSADIARLMKEIADRRAHLAQAKARYLARHQGNGALPEHRYVVETTWFTIWSRHAPAIAKAEGSLARALARVAVATEKAEDAETREREASRQRAAIRARNVALFRRLDALREAAPAIKQRWEAERRDEEKRLKKLKKKIEARTRKDLLTGPKRRGRWWEKPVALPPPIEQPDLTEDAVDNAPPREGLIPGTYRVVDPARLRINLLDDEPLPPAWNARHVGRRLIEAHDVLRRLPMNVRPQGYSALWPEYVTEAGEMAIQSGAGTLAIGRNVVFKTASSDEVARMSEAMGWIVQYLAGCNAWALSALNRWAADRESTPDDDDAPVDLLDFIAAALNAAKEVVR